MPVVEKATTPEMLQGSQQVIALFKEALGVPTRRTVTQGAQTLSFRHLASQGPAVLVGRCLVDMEVCRKREGTELCGSVATTQCSPE